MAKCKTAILGAGNIANAMAEAMNGIADQVECYAVASRSLDKAEAFAKKWGFQKSYGSYEELVKDPEVQLIYIATPHSHHYEHAKLCIEHNKPILVEKAFTGNLNQAKEILSLAEEKKVFVSEAIWTRFIPARHVVKEILDSGVLGEIQSLEAEFSFHGEHIERMYNPALAGGALLDLGMYCLTFASMYFGDDYVEVESSCEKYETGVDAESETVYTYADGKKAIIKSAFVSGPRNEGIIYGTKGSLYIKDLNNYSQIIRRDLDGNEVQSYPIPEQINGYEYEVLACVDALEKGKLQCEEMPHEETLEIMYQMDSLRQMWDVVYPFD